MSVFVPCRECTLFNLIMMLAQFLIFGEYHKRALCSASNAGEWSSWSLDGKCTRSCGGGKLMITRRCLKPPCAGGSKKTSGECNTRPCPMCFTAKGETFRGRISVANDGTACQRWNVDYPHDHPDIRVNTYPELEANYCRNPGGVLERPWCYRNSMEGPPKMYCDIPECGTDFEQATIAYTIPSSLSRGTDQKPCVFPYRYQSEWYDACLLLDTKQQGMEKCSTSANDQVHFNFCPLFYRGLWSAWKNNGDCTKSCDGGQVVRFRVCLLAPCSGSAVATDKDQVCNNHRCPPSQPGSDDCFVGSGMLYSGRTDRSVSGKQCEPWQQVSSIYDNRMLPQGLPRLEYNHCRNPSPGAMSGPWCFVKTVGIVHKEYCDVVVCPTKPGEIFGVFLNKASFRGLNKPCIFPFLGEDSKFHFSCQPVVANSQNNLKYCALEKVTRSSGSDGQSQSEGQIIAQRLREGSYGMCAPSTRGTWSPWANVGSCSAACGGGKIVRSRHCRHPPCGMRGSSAVRSVQPCNTQSCLNCLQGNGETYGGKVSKDYRGRECLMWKLFENAETQFKVSKYTILEKNYCRNPGGVLLLPWCYINEQMTKYLCEIPHCNDNNIHVIPYTLPVVGHDLSRRACVAPYQYLGDWYYGCFPDPGGKQFSYCPKTNEWDVDKRTWAVCPSIYKQKWSAWNITAVCTKRCGGGLFTHVRECLYPPCVGSKLKFEEECNTHPCSWKATAVNENVNCFIGEGQAYTGSVSVTVSNFACLSWRSQQPIHHFYPVTGSGIDLNHNFCRNPAPLGHRTGPWCFVNPQIVMAPRWEYCDVPRCQAHEGEIITIEGKDNNRSCHFPFASQGVTHESCVPLRLRIQKDWKVSYLSNIFFCATTSESDQHPSRPQDTKWGICPQSARGTVGPWTVWPGERWCSKPCGGGKVRFYRRCRLPPCERPLITEKYMGKCNSKRCEECVEGDGVTYRGTTFIMPKRYQCQKWTEVRRYMRMFTRTDVLEGGDHAYCRNPFPERYKLPFCFAEDKEKVGSVSIVICDIPRCEPSSWVVTVGGAPSRIGQFCVFPFMSNGQPVESCVALPSGKSYCGIQRGKMDVAREGLSGTCSPNDKGTWSDWTRTGRCTRVCGEGKIIHRRFCRYAPCVGPQEKYGEKCNMHVCDRRINCYDVYTRGREFNGNLALFSRGRPCQNWRNAPEFYRFRSSNPNLDLTGSACRNPDGELPRPYCVTNLQRQRLSLAYCNVPPCPNPALILVSTPQTNSRPPYSPCIFPFVYKRVKYYSCVTIDTPPFRYSSPGRSWCGTAERVYRYEWGYCPVQARGKWSLWSSSKRTCTAACVWFQERACLFPPCSGRPWRFEPQACKGPACLESRWSKWGSWTRCSGCLLVRVRYRQCLRAGAKSDVEPTDRSFCVGLSVDSERCPSATNVKCNEQHAHLFQTERNVRDIVKYYSKYFPEASGCEFHLCYRKFSLIACCLLVNVWHLFL